MFLRCTTKSRACFGRNMRERGNPACSCDAARKRKCVLGGTCGRGNPHVPVLPREIENGFWEEHADFLILSYGILGRIRSRSTSCSSERTPYVEFKKSSDHFPGIYELALHTKFAYLPRPVWEDSEVFRRLPIHWQNEIVPVLFLKGLLFPRTIPELSCRGHKSFM
jgi:hypothetical protein